MARGAKSTASKAAVWVILLLLIVGLAGFGATSFGGSTQAIGSVGDEEVTVQEYANALQQDLTRFQQQTGQAMPLSQAIQFGVDQAVLQRLLRTAALDNETKRLGLSVGDVEVRDRLLSAGGFQGLDGNFDREAYRYALERANVSEAQFEDSLRLDAARAMLQGAIVGGVTPQATFSDALLTYVAETRNFTWAKISGADIITGIAVPDEAQLRAYYDENPAEFTAPETRKLTHIALTHEMLIDEVEVEEDLLREAFADRAAEFNRPERRLVERLVFPSEDTATAAKARLDAGELSFEDLVEERGLSLADVDMGDVTEDELDGAGPAIFALDDTGVAGPLPTSLGPALFRMNAVLAAQSTSYEDARPLLFDEFAADRARRYVSDEINNVDDLLAGGATLEEVAEETPLVLGTTDWHADAEGDLTGYEAFRTEAAQIKVGDFAEVKELDDGGIFALRLDEIIPPTLRPFAEVTEDVRAAWVARETTKEATALAETLLAQLTPETDIASLGVTANEEADLNREAFIEDTPSDLVSQAFEMAPGEARVIPGDQAAYLLRLDGINTADRDDPETALVARAIDTQTTQSMAQDIFEAFTNAVQADAGISINQAAINAVHAQFP